MTWTNHPVYTFIIGIGVGFTACTAIGFTQSFFINKSLEEEVLSLNNNILKKEDMIKNKEDLIEVKNKQILQQQAEILAYRQNYPNFRQEVENYKKNSESLKNSIDFYNKNCSIYTQINSLDQKKYDVQKNLRRAKQFNADLTSYENDIQSIDNRILELTRKMNCEHS